MLFYFSVKTLRNIATKQTLKDKVASFRAIRNNEEFEIKA